MKLESEILAPDILALEFCNVYFSKKKKNTALGYFGANHYSEITIFFSWRKILIMNNIVIQMNTAPTIFE